ncbi:MAG: UDP-4-amino-4,6-dideoxy-N-acetyl-beta-L-altrosamine transaminase [Gammaproteobacteria bacterium]|nr:UDP-4-amino-4,6-dideoxy-N-acetyl-beta-L-altrosamine transaminase [Gammaproteobacteria bacterium]
MLPYGRQTIDQQDIDAVVETLRSPWLTTGPKVSQFEDAIAKFCGAEYAIAVSSGTAALHCAMASIGIGPGDEVIVPTMTFLATANCVVYQGGTPVFADVDADTLLLDTASVEQRISARTRAIIAMDFAGQACDYDALRKIADRHNLILVADACHSLGASYKGRPVGTLADITVFSFHPVKAIACGEGGMLVTNNKSLAEFSRRFRNHGMSRDSQQRELSNNWYYEMHAPGYNYRMSDIHAALGLSQLSKLKHFIDRRREIAQIYNEVFSTVFGIAPLSTVSEIGHAWHLYIISISDGELDRDELFAQLRKAQIGVNVHYFPVHLQPFYKEMYPAANCVVAEQVSRQIISLPIFPAMTNADVQRVIETILGLVDSLRSQ